MTKEKWLDMIDMVEDKFGIDKEYKEIISPNIPGEKHIIEFSGPIGRMKIEFTKKMLQDNFPEVEVVYGDTDSVFVKIKETDLEKAKIVGDKISTFVTEKLPGVLELEFEKVFTRFLMPTVRGSEVGAKKKIRRIN